MTTVLRKSLFDYMDLETRNQWLAHREDFVKNVNRWKLTDESRQLLMRAPEVAFDTETIPEPPPGTYQHLTDGVRKNLGLTYLTDVTHVSFYALVDGQEVVVVLVAPFTEEELDFVRELFSRKDVLVITHNGVFDFRIFCGHHDIPLPEHTYCTMVGNTTMFGGPKGGYPGRFTRGLDSLSRAYGVDSKTIDYARDVASEWFGPELALLWTKLNAVGPSDLASKSDLKPDTVKYFLQHKPAQVTDFPIQMVVNEWIEFMKRNRSVLHTLPVHYVAVYVVTDSVSTYWVYRAQMRWSKILQEEYGYTRLWEMHRESQEYQNVMNYWAVRGVPVNREWISRQLELIEQEKWRWIPYFIERGCGDLSKANQKFRFVFDICHAPKPDPWEYVEFSNGRGKWYPAEMQGHLWTKAGKEYLEEHGWEEGKNYSQWYATGTKAVHYYMKFGPEEHRSKLELYQYFTGMVAQEGTYREWLDHSSYDGKVHFQASATANTGRTITNTPNGQNVNMHMPATIQVYDPATGGTVDVVEFTGLGMLMPHPGKVLLEFDLNGAEVRFAAVLANAKNLARAFAEKRDLHRENAAAFNRIPVEEVTKTQRNDGKSFFFAMQYGAGARSLSSHHKILIPVASSESMVSGWNAVNWEVGEAKKRIENDAHRRMLRMQRFPLKMGQQAYTELFNGRWVPAPSYRGQPKLYTTWNSQQQGGVGGIAMPAIIAAHRYFQQHPELESDMFLMVHDSIIAEVPDDNWELVQQAGSYISMQLMTQVPLEITVVDGIPVPWLSGCDLYENQHKWGWRPDQDFPYYCGEDEGEVVIAFPEEEAWQIMKDKSLARQKQELKDLLRTIDAHYASPPVEKLIWHTPETETDTCILWNDAVQYSPGEHYAQSRYWGWVVRQHQDELPDNVKQLVNEYRVWVARLEQLDMQYKEAKERYEQTKRFGENAV